MITSNDTAGLSCEDWEALGNPTRAEMARIDAQLDAEEAAWAGQKPHYYDCPAHVDYLGTPGVCVGCAEDDGEDDDGE